MLRTLQGDISVIIITYDDKHWIKDYVDVGGTYSSWCIACELSFITC